MYLKAGECVRMDECPGVGGMIKILKETIDRDINRSVREQGVTAAQMRAMVTLHRAGEPIPEKRLEQELHISQPSTVNLVRRMESKGFVGTKPSEADGRSTLVFLTEEGREKCRLTRDDMIQTEKRMIDGFSEEELKQFESYLWRVYSNLNPAE